MIATRAEFNTLIKSSGAKLVVVDFTASWCPPCKMIAPKFAMHASKVKDYATLVKVDVDLNKDTPQACGITAMPTFQFYKNGSMVHQIKGADWDAVVAKIEELR